MKNYELVHGSILSLQEDDPKENFLIIRNLTELKKVSSAFGRTKIPKQPKYQICLFAKNKALAKELEEQINKYVTAVKVRINL